MSPSPKRRDYFSVSVATQESAACRALLARRISLHDSIICNGLDFAVVVADTDQHREVAPDRGGRLSGWLFGGGNLAQSLSLTRAAGYLSEAARGLTPLTSTSCRARVGRVRLHVRRSE